MKSTFSKTWNKSTQIRKQRKYRYNAPLHVKGSFLNVHLDASLRKKYQTRSLRVRKGDTVKVCRGQYKGKVGKVEDVDVGYTKVMITGIHRVRKDGTKHLIPFQPSNLLITDIATGDKKRIAKLKGGKEKPQKETKND